MKRILIIAIGLCMCAFTSWHNNIEEAKEIARREHKHILLNFSGSDWCGPCIRMHKEVFTDTSFTALAATSLVMVNADFPRSKKHQLSKTQQELNNAMADQYNARGNFPCTLLLNADGKILKEWDGFPQGGAAAFTEDVKNVLDSDH